MSTRSNQSLAWGLGIVFGLIFLQKAFIMYTDYLWYQSLAQGAVYMTILGTRVLLFLVAGGLFFFWLHCNLRYARRPLPGDVKLIGRRLLPDEERNQIEAYADKGLLVFALVGAFMAGVVASGKWRELLQFTHALPFGDNDVVFNIDLGFYIFRLSFLNYVWQSAFFAIVLAFVASGLVHIYQEALRLVGNKVHATPQARLHLLGLLGLALLVKAYLYRLAQFGLLYSNRGEEFFGPGFADLHARLPMLYALMVVAVLAAVVMWVSIRGQGHKVPAAALAAVVLVSLLGGWIYPALVQSMVVKPNQLDKERSYISNNITATLKAYGLDTINHSRHVIRQDLGWPAIEANRATVDNIRLWDHRPLQTTYQQTQALRPYYNFTDVDVDRYEVNGKERQVMLAARQLNYAGINRPNWQSQHLMYTHGYGLCLSPVNEITGDGMPSYWVRDLPVTSDAGFNVTRPQLYYHTSSHPRLIEYISPPEHPWEADPEATPAPAGGPGADAGPQAGGGPAGAAAAAAGGPPPARAQAAPRPPAVADMPYVIVNTRQKELDYPAQEGTNEDDTNAYTEYKGTGDVQLSNAWRRFCFFMRYRDLKILLTSSITKDSRILFNRALPERLSALAPILGYDPDPYLVIAADGTLKWINDAYTASNMYPYAARIPWFGANYVRNSVKVITDAYEGKPTFYVMPPAKGAKADPVLECWRKIFPTLFTDFSAMPEDLRKHLRYPQLMFRIQTEIYCKYHMVDPQTFFQKEDQWAIPPEVYSKGRRDVESFYVNMQLPKPLGAKEEFLLMQPLALAKREDKNMVAWMAARCDAPHYGELVCYDFPKSTLVKGPMQAESLISQDAEISQLLTLWNQQGSQVIRGNLLVIPIEQSLLYVEPIYLEAPNSPLPQLKLVVLAYDDQIVNASTLDDALRKLFGRTAGGSSPLQALSSAPPVQPIKTANTIKALLQQALDLDAQAQQAMSRGDLAGYQAKQQQQHALIEQAAKLAQ